MEIIQNHPFFLSKITGIRGKWQVIFADGYSLEQVRIFALLFALFCSFSLIFAHFGGQAEYTSVDDDGQTVVPTPGGYTIVYEMLYTITNPSIHPCFPVDLSHASSPE